MQPQLQKIKPSKQLFQCKICTQILVKPVTLPCGHSFCRSCLTTQFIKSSQKPPETQPRKNSQIIYDSNNNKIAIQLQAQSEQIQIENPSNTSISKIPICVECQSIIWRSIDTMNENIILQTLLEKHYYVQMKQRMKNNKKLTQGSISNSKRKENVEMVTEILTNKILIQIKQSNKILPMPNCYSEIQFSSPFISEIRQQSHQIVITWKQLSDKGLGLLGTLKKIDPINPSSHFSKHVIQDCHNIQILNQKFKAIFLGKAFVKFTDIGSVTINIRNKFIIISEKKINKILVDLPLCDCKLYHAKHYNTLSMEDFDDFFAVYDQMNNPHYMRQIYKLVAEEPFLNRNSPECMIYCALRILKIPKQKRKQLVMCFDDQSRIQYINQFISEKKSLTLDEIMNVSVPGKSSPGIVLAIIFLLFLLNITQDYFLDNDIPNTN